MSKWQGFKRGLSPHWDDDDYEIFGMLVRSFILILVVGSILVLGIYIASHGAGAD